ncbi:hypothetical protein [Cytobacillus oceanisediminis]|uniref:hypothetical protein n=1 Tax=Cytobacillus oceanisediminis TaxID=665099 RepID=UPI00254B58D5|nr:hypothetical protein [Cytobacillus oceanisediminis]MDK7664379.1 hypothetical protein [Cytobacillus oceanisediminis]
MLETQYYFKDLPQLLEEKAKEKNEKILEQIFILLATNQRSLAEDDYKKFISGLTKGFKKQSGLEFNRDKMEELRLMTNFGANKTR